MYTTSRPPIHHHHHPLCRLADLLHNTHSSSTPRQVGTRQCPHKTAAAMAAQLTTPPWQSSQGLTQKSKDAHSQRLCLPQAALLAVERERNARRHDWQLEQHTHKQTQTCLCMCQNHSVCWPWKIDRPHHSRLHCSCCTKQSSHNRELLTAKGSSNLWA